jgi:nitrogen regulatory protein PII
MLKLIRCVIALEDWAPVVSRVVSVGADITVYRTWEDSPHRNRMAVYRGRKYEVQLPGLVLEIVTDDSWTADIIATIERAQKDCLTGGRAIEVFPVEESYRIRDGFMDRR